MNNMYNMYNMNNMNNIYNFLPFIIHIIFSKNMILLYLKIKNIKLIFNLQLSLINDTNTDIFKIYYLKFII